MAVFSGAIGLADILQSKGVEGKMKRISVWLAFFGLLFSCTAFSAEKVNVVVSFSILADLVHQVGKERVIVHSIVGADENAHGYQPTPADSKAIRGANLVVINGLNFDIWMQKLIKSSGYKGPVLVASRGIVPIKSKPEPGHKGHGHGEVDPHAWHDIYNVTRYVDNIAFDLGRIDPENKAFYQKNASAYKAALSALDAELKKQFNQIEKNRRRILVSHDAFAYLARRYGLIIISLQGVNPEAEATAADMAKVIRQIKTNQVRAIFVENISDERLLKQISRETGVAIGGVLFSGALSKPTEPAKTYIDLMRFNAGQIVKALRQ